ncbi:MAG: hypothetical protein IPG49_04865 [Proteobacteria bacterium]|nr:hypothetical protein [Pseudomonadota bacterium]
MPAGRLREELQACAAGPFRRSGFSIAHRGAPLMFPEHTREGYAAAARMGAGAIECDVTFTRDGELVCRHDECDLHSTTDIVTTPPERAVQHALVGAWQPAEVLRQRSHTRPVPLTARQDGRQQSGGDHAQGVPGSHTFLAHRPVCRTRHPHDPAGQHPPEPATGRQACAGAEVRRYGSHRAHLQRTGAVRAKAG